MLPVTLQKWPEEHNEFKAVGLASKFSTSQSVRASVGATSQLTGLKGSSANVLVPDTTAHLQRACGAHASMDQNCFVRKRWLCGYNIVANRCVCSHISRLF